MTAAGRTPLFRRIPAGVGTGGPYLFGGKELDAADGRRLPAISLGTGLATARRHRVHRGRRLARRAPSPTWSARGPSSAAATSAARSAPATISSKSRWSTRSSTSRPPRCMGLQPGQICVMIHSGSRGLGYQVCDDALRDARKRAGQVRHRACPTGSWPAPGREPRGPDVPGRHAGGGQLRLGQPAAAHVAGPRGLRRVLRPHPGRRCR